MIVSITGARNATQLDQTLQFEASSARPRRRAGQLPGKAVHAFAARTKLSASLFAAICCTLAGSERTLLLGNKTRKFWQCWCTCDNFVARSAGAGWQGTAVRLGAHIARFQDHWTCEIQCARENGGKR
eukprot:jgi/Bigna1/62700/fgenesh1_kg.40_\